ncbi:serine hydrolase domain-containing protein [Polaribacter septentrionalilitoris]|uniref:serine hydrolase domain-containing protein n=1 Tax=Polaribacter septentrionalilitoris TaxID=2494657 RepID=UPI00135A4DBA|nr:serine hydrolase domain-containing protein [Polaribacter septentrionalilitoris]
MKKYSKEILISLIAIFILFLFSQSTSGVKEKKVLPKAEVTEKPIVKKPIVSVEYHSKELTKKVNHKLDSLIKRIHKRHDFHGAILVAKNKKIVYKNQIGYADFRKKIPIKEESTFQLASVSKQFTAVAIMLLAERNKLKITDTINTYFPDFPYENITIKNLLNHTAGLPKYFWVAEHKWNKKVPPTNSDMMQLLTSSNVGRFFRPGRNFDYSNTAYFVLASIVEKISGTSFNNFLQKNIFEPLDMKNSYVYSAVNDDVHQNQLKGFRLYRGWKHISIGNTVNDAVVGDKNVYSTAEDLYKWTYGLNSGKLLSKESLDLMYANGETIYGRKVPYGFGFRIDPREKNKIYHHGKWNGFSTALTNYLEDDLVIIVLEHTSYNALKSLNRKIKKIITQNFAV